MMEAAVGFAQALALVRRSVLVAAIVGAALGALCIGVGVVSKQSPSTLHQPDPPVAQVIP